MGTVDTDEDDDPWDGNGCLYGNDRPSWTGSGNAIVKKMNMREWVRIQLGDTSFKHDDTKILQDVQGSRSSFKQDWHCVYHLVRNPDGKWREDNTDTTYSAPLRTTVGNGRIAITLDKDAVTEGFTTRYQDAFRRMWTLSGTKSWPTTVSDWDYPMSDGYWKLPFLNKVTVEIWEGDTSFANDDQFNFSVFKRYLKENNLGLGFFDVTK